MKKFFATLFVLAICAMSAQAQRIFLFDDFCNSIIRMKNGSRFQAPVNYDANGGKIYFMQDGQMMEMTNTLAIDTMTVGERKFVGLKGDIAELYQGENGLVKIRWRIRKIHDGYVGAFGATTQAHSSKLQLNSGLGMGEISGTGGGMYNGSFGVNDDKEGGRNNDVWRIKTENTYFFVKDGKEYSVSRLKQLYKLFPDKKGQIQQFVHDNSLDLMSAEKALRVIDYVLSL